MCKSCIDLSKLEIYMKLEKFINGLKYRSSTDLLNMYYDVAFKSED